MRAGPTGNRLICGYQPRQGHGRRSAEEQADEAAPHSVADLAEGEMAEVVACQHRAEQPQREGGITPAGAPQRQRGGHRTLAEEGGGVSTKLHTITTYHGPGMLLSYLTGFYEGVMIIAHTPVDDGTVKVWHALCVKSPSNSAQIGRAHV